MAISTRCTHLFVVIWGSVEIALFAGQIFGWASLVYVLKEQGYFGESCLPTTSTSQVGAHSNDTSFVPETHLNGLHNGSVGYNYSRLRRDAETHFVGLNLNSSSDDDDRDAILTDRKLPPFKGEGEEGDGFTCVSQDESLGLVYTVAVVINGCLSVVIGSMLDHLGTRITRSLGIPLYICSLVLVAFSSPDTPLMLYPAMTCLAFGGYFIMMTNIQLANLIPSKRSTVIALYCGSYDSSAFILVLVKWAYEAGVATRHSFIFLTCLSSMLLVSTFAHHVRRTIPWPLPAGYHHSALTLKLCQGNSPGGTVMQEMKEKTTAGDGPRKRNLLKKQSENDENGDVLHDDSGADLMNGVNCVANGNSMLENDVFEEEEEEGQTEEMVTLKQVLTSTLFIWDAVWMCCHRLRSWFFVGIFNPWITHLAEGNLETVSFYTSVYATMQFFGIFTAPLSGLLMDRKRKGADTGRHPRLDRIEMSILSFVLNTGIGILLTIGTCIPVIEFQYVTFILHCLHRSFLYGPNTAFIANAFPQRHFGKIFGVVLSLSAMFSMLQYPLFILVQGVMKNNALVANLIILVLMVVSLGHPVYMWRYCKMERAKAAAANARLSPIYRAAPKLSVNA